MAGRDCGKERPQLWWQRKGFRDLMMREEGAGTLTQILGTGLSHPGRGQEVTCQVVLCACVAGAELPPLPRCQPCPGLNQHPCAAQPGFPRQAQGDECPLLRTGSLSSFFKKKDLFFTAPSLPCCMGFSLVAERGGYSLVVSSLAWSRGSRAPGLSSCRLLGSRAHTQ